MLCVGRTQSVKGPGSHTWGFLVKKESHRGLLRTRPPTYGSHSQDHRVASRGVAARWPVLRILDLPAPPPITWGIP